MKRIITASLITLLSACASVPESLQLAESTNLLSYHQASVADNQPEQMARWGGVIAKIENLKTQTRIEVVNFSLLANTRPKVGNESEGRFVAYVDGLLDPIIYKVGSEITFVGKTSIKEQGKIGEHPYVFPTLKVTGLHLWPKKQRVDVEVYQNPFYVGSPYWRYDPWPYHRSTVVVSKSTANKLGKKPSNKPAIKSSRKPE